jgi:hypothetical protein
MGPALDFFKADRDYPELMRAIRAYDRQVVVYHNKSIARWSLAHASSNGIFHVTTWAWPNGSYRPLDSSIILFLRGSDLWKSGFKSADEMDDTQTYEDELRERKTDSDFGDDIDYLSRWNRKQQQEIKDLLTSL